MYKKFKQFSATLAVTAFLFLVVFSVANAGSLTPSASPTAQSYTFSDIWARLTTNTSATAGNHSLNATTTPGATFPNLTSIYNAIPTIYASDFLASSTYFGVTGTVAVKTGNTAMASSSAQGTSLVFTIPQGYYDGTDSVTVSTTSSAFSAANISNGVNLFGIVGTLLGYAYGGNAIDQVLTTATGTPGTYDPSNLVAANVKSGITFGTSTTGSLLPSGGTATAADVASGKTFFGSSQTDWNLQTGTASAIDYSLQSLQTRDDYVDSAGTTGEYTAEEAGVWPAVDGSPFATDAISYNPVGADLTLRSGVVEQDPRTGLWWSDMMSVGATASTTSNVFDPATDGTRPTGGNAIGFCNALNTANFGGHNDWYLPTQKQLMQAYIDGAANNIPNPGNSFWSSTEYSSGSANAWRVALSNGYAGSSAKTSSYDVRCVRP